MGSVHSSMKGPPTNRAQTTGAHTALSISLSECEDFKKWTLNMLSEKNRENIRSSWHSAQDKNQIVMRACSTTLAAEKDFRIAFKVDKIKVQDISQDPLLVAHGRSFQTFLTQATDYLVQDERRFEELMSRIARSHLNVEAPFKPQYFYMLSANIVDSLVQSLTSSHNTPDKLQADYLRKIWMIFMGAMSNEIRKALYRRQWRLGLTIVSAFKPADPQGVTKAEATKMT